VIADVVKGERVPDGSQRQESERAALIRERDRARRDRRWADADAVERDLAALDAAAPVVEGEVVELA